MASNARPENHVTRTMSLRLGLSESNGNRLGELPMLDEEAIRNLEALFPPRCLEPGETVEAHVRYAANVSLVQALRFRFEAGLAARLEASDPDDLSATGIPTGAERAR